MTIHLDNNEAHLLQTMLKVELMRATSVSYAKEIKPLADCIEGLLDKLQPKQKMEIRIKRVSQEVARNIDERMRRQGGFMTGLIILGGSLSLSAGIWIFSMLLILVPALPAVGLESQLP